MKKTLTAPRCTISDLGISPRDATYWDKQGILPKLIGKGMRRKYTLPQALWIKLITQLRSLDVSIKLIKKFKDHLLEELSGEEFLKNPESRANLQRYLNEQGENINLNQIYESEEYDKHHTFNPYEIFVVAVVVLRREMAFFIRDDGEYLPYSPEKHDELGKLMPNFNSVIASPHITVSLSEAYSDLVVQWEPKEFFKDISIMSQQEHKILEAVKLKGVKQVIINYKKNGQLDRLEIKKEKKIDIASRVAENLSKHGYEDLTIKSAEGTILHCEKTIKIKL